MPDDHLSRSGHGGHSVLFRHLRAVANDFLIRERAALLELAQRYNARIASLSTARPDDGFEPWSAADLEHKVDEPCSGIAPEYPPGRD